MPVVAARFVPNHKGMRAQMMSDDTQDVADKAARDVIFAALPISPESDPTEKGASDGTSYKQHFSVRQIVVTINGNPRRAAAAVNDSKYAAQVEFGTGPGWKGERRQGGTPGTPSRVLGRAGATVGQYRGGVG